MIKFKKLNKLERRSLQMISSFYSHCRNVFYDFDNTTNKIDEKAWSAIPIDNCIIEKLAILRKTFNKEKEFLSFIDVGAGKGNVMGAAAAVGFDTTTGIEFNKTYRQSVQDTLRYYWMDAFEVTKEMINSAAFQFGKQRSVRNIFHIYQIFKDRTKLGELYKYYYSLCNPGDLILISGDAPQTSFGLKTIYCSNTRLHYILKG